MARKLNGAGESFARSLINLGLGLLQLDKEQGKMGTPIFSMQPVN